MYMGAHSGKPWNLPIIACLVSSYFLKDLLVALGLLVEEFVSVWAWLIIHLRYSVLPFRKGLSCLFVWGSL